MNPIPTFEEAWSLYHRKIRNFCLRLTRDPDQAEDLTQDVFLQLYRNLDKFRGESRFYTWLHRLTINVFLMKIRRKRTETISLDMLQEDEVDESRTARQSYQEAIIVRDHDLEFCIERCELMERIEQLPPGYQLALICHDLEGMEHNEIAEMLQTSIGLSKSQLFKARNQLRRMFGIEAEDEDINEVDLNSLFASLEKYADPSEYRAVSES